MTGSLGRAAPVRFLLGVVICWTIGRGLILFGWAPDAAAGHDVGVSARPSERRATPSPLIASSSPRPGRSIMPVAEPSLRRVSWQASPALPTDRHADPTPVPLSAETHEPAASLATPAASYAAAPPSIGTTSGAKSRWSGSAWVLVRGGGRATALSPGGQIGGGQGGVRMLYRIDDDGQVALSGRVSRAIGGARQTEAAAGLDVKPISTVPVHLMVERRVAIDRGGRNAWTAGAAGGVDDVVLVPGWRLDGYGEAGVVGARRRDLYGDGAMRIARAIDLGQGRSLALGGGVWGAAQPGVARLDVGPSAVLRLSVVRHFVAVAVDWRQRVAGGAKPGSGPALTIGTDF